MKKLIEPYIRLGRFDKPIGGMLVLWPCSWSASLASASGFPHLGWYACAVGASFMLRAAGCTANDWWDREIDKKVERTKNRPLASGEISQKGAAAFFLFNLAPIPVAWSLMGPNTRSFLLMSLPLLSLYPTAKRFTNWPQAVLGLAMNYGCLVNYVFLTEKLDPSITVPLYLGSWCWTMVYDSIYAYQDVKDDRKIGVGSTALTWGENYKPFCALFTAGSALGWGLCGVSANLGWGYFVCLGASISHMTYQWTTVDIKNVDDCWKKFVSNQWMGGIMLLGFFLGKVTRKEENK
mmetsp:Transcript_4895/g.7373  ORF Transcript_4895/g.7373 Transcript_4895/m.7373 type:complete len:293 (+) Transcript_4895:3-881(+)